MKTEKMSEEDVEQYKKAYSLFVDLVHINQIDTKIVLSVIQSLTCAIFKKEGLSYKDYKTFMNNYPDFMKKYWDELK